MLDLIAFLIFIVFVGVFLYKDRRNIKFTGIIFMRRTDKGKKFISRVAKNHRFWSAIAIIAIVTAIPALFLSSIWLFSNSIAILTKEAKEGVRIVLPWVGFETKPGLLLLPWWFWVIGIFSVIVPHELFHGIICRLEKIRIKSIGYLFLLFIPGAFVEPDEKQLKKASRKTKLKIYSAGSFANFLVALVFWFLTFFLITGFFHVAGVFPTGLMKDYPAANASMRGAIIAIGGYEVRSPENISQILEKIPIGSNITIKTTVGEYNITTVRHPELNKSFIGIIGPYHPYYEPKNKAIASQLNFLYDLFFWIFLLNLGIALVNLLPIKPLDGGLIFEEIIGRFVRNKNNVRAIVIAVSIFMIFLLFFNLFGPTLI